MRKSFATQPALFAGPELFDHPALKALDPVEALFDWEALAGLLVDEGKKATGRPGYPVQTLLRALLLGIWHGLSDEQLAAQLARDLCSASSAGWSSMPRPRMRPRSAASGRSWRRRGSSRHCSRR